MEKGKTTKAMSGQGVTERKWPRRTDVDRDYLLPACQEEGGQGAGLHRPQTGII